MTISQREARRLRKRVAELEDQDDSRRLRWAGDWPGGVEIARVQFSEMGAPMAIRTARKLKHAVVAIENGSCEVRFLALPLAERNR